MHAHPDHLSSWAVLAASVTATSIARNRERLERERGILDTRIAQFVQMKGEVHDEHACLKTLKQMLNSEYLDTRKLNVVI